MAATVLLAELARLNGAVPPESDAPLAPETALSAGEGKVPPAAAIVRPPTDRRLCTVLGRWYCKTLRSQSFPAGSLTDAATSPADAAISPDDAGSIETLDAQILAELALGPSLAAAPVPEDGRLLLFLACSWGLTSLCVITY